MLGGGMLESRINSPSLPGGGEDFCVIVDDDDDHTIEQVCRKLLFAQEIVICIGH